MTDDRLLFSTSPSASPTLLFCPDWKKKKTSTLLLLSSISAMLSSFSSRRIYTVCQWREGRQLNSHDYSCLRCQCCNHDKTMNFLGALFLFFVSLSEVYLLTTVSELAWILLSTTAAKMRISALTMLPQCYNKTQHQCDKINAEISLGEFPRKLCRLTQLWHSFESSTTFSEFPFLAVSRTEQKRTSFYGKMKVCWQRMKALQLFMFRLNSQSPKFPFMLCFSITAYFLSIFPSESVLIANCHILLLNCQYNLLIHFKPCTLAAFKVPLIDCLLIFIMCLVNANNLVID